MPLLTVGDVEGGRVEVSVVVGGLGGWGGVTVNCRKKKNEKLGCDFQGGRPGPTREAQLKRLEVRPRSSVM